MPNITAYRHPNPPIGGTSVVLQSAISAMDTVSSVGAVSQMALVILLPSAENVKVMCSKGKMVGVVLHRSVASLKATAGKGPSAGKSPWSKPKRCWLLALTLPSAHSSTIVYTPPQSGSAFLYSASIPRKTLYGNGGADDISHRRPIQEPYIHSHTTPTQTVYPLSDRHPISCIVPSLKEHHTHTIPGENKYGAQSMRSYHTEAVQLRLQRILSHHHHTPLLRMSR